MDNSSGQTLEPDQPGEAGGPGSKTEPGRFGLLFSIGSVALLAGMATDFVSVVCRHLHIPFIGALEIIQVCVVVAISAAVVAATVTGAHASVHLLTERMTPSWRGRLRRSADGLGAVAFALMAVGDLWIFADTLGWDERSDLLGIPVWPQRLVWSLSLAVVALLFGWRALRKPAEPC